MERYMIYLFYLSMILLTILPINIIIVFAQQNITELDLDGNITDAAFSLAKYHIDLGKQELAIKNFSGASYHFNLGGMSQDQIREMVQGTLKFEDIQKLESNAANCIIFSKGSVGCIE